ncbi:subtilisin-like protein [Exidia glandulosa HHB12029]|uniref:tripeptidyl-peptidase II n=1 Tax=Exidia glandulosa HHB12029 TaxID=1314781 RepID=A0A165BK09_EXIGL|nr:subtilisin-like protein [Exidia glandulosa HHB12029]
MLLPSLSLLALLSGLVCATPTPSPSMYVHAQRTRPARGFVALSTASSDHMLDMRIHLAQRDPAGLRAVLDAVSDPSNPQYGQYLSRAQVESFTRPTDETRNAVNNWLATHGLNATDASSAGDWIAVQVPASVANTMLGAEYRLFAHERSNSTLVRTLSYSLPLSLQGHVKTVWPGTSFFNPHALPVSAVQPLRRSGPVPELVKRFDLSEINAVLGKYGLKPVSSSAKVSVSNSTTVLTPNDSATDRAHIDEILKNLGLPSLESGDVKVIVNDGPGTVFNGTTGSLPDWIQCILDHRSDCSIPGTGTGTTVAPSPPKQTTTKTKTTRTVTTTITITPTDEPTAAPPQPTSTSSSAPAPVPPPQHSSNPAPQPTSAPAPQIPAPTPGKTDASCKNTVTPKCLQQLYQIPTTRAKVASNKIGVTAYINQFGQKSDLRSFLQQFRPDIDDANTGFNTQSIDGGVNPQGSGSAGVEANLDLQYTIGLATGVPTTFITVGNQGRNGFLDTITQLLASDSPPQVLTTSYGQSEDDVAPQDAEAMCNAYMQLGARGVSILFASGDSGVGDSNDECKRDGKFQPTFPAGCPFLTAVGSTDGIAPERGASFSSGGFSELFAQPSYQSSHISTFLSRSSVSPSSGRFNPSGRAFPDVSTLGTRFAVINGGRTTGVQGTSASSPVFASIIALLNDERAQRGMPPLGFLNPWLYGKASGAFMDVVEGNNPGCGTDGFEAAKGWDPVTGLGTPSYPALRVAAGLA